jgi:hypothetical protein
MNNNRRPRLTQSLSLIACLYALLAPGLTSAAEEDVSQHDPQRWYQGADTPGLHYRNLLREAQAAYAEAQQECSHLKVHETRACREEARANLRADKARAGRILKQLKRQ